MKKLLSFLLIAALALTTQAQERMIYDANAEKRMVTSFHAIKVSQGIELLIKQGNEEALAISADKKEYADAVKTEVVNGELRIYIKQDMEKWWQQLRRKGVQVKAYVAFKNLDELDGSSGSKIIVDGSLNGQKLSVELSSGATLSGELAVNILDIDLSSGAKSTVKGHAESMRVETSSGGHFSGYGLSTVTAKAEASSGGKTELLVSKELSVKASSGGAITYKGAGSISTISTSSGGKVRKVS